MEFLKKHYEKMVLCVILLGLAGAAVWMKSAIDKVQSEAGGPGRPPQKPATYTNVDFSGFQQALSKITNPPPVVLSGVHNLFDPVTWKRKPDGSLLKILVTGPDALVVNNITKLYTIVSYKTNIEGRTFEMEVQREVDLSQPARRRPQTEYARLNDKGSVKSGLFVVRGVRGDETNPSEINLEFPGTGESVWVSANNPYKRVEDHIVDMKYDPEPSLPLNRRRVKDKFKLDGEPYIIVEITDDTVRVQNEHTTKVTEIRWTHSP